MFRGRERFRIGQRSRKDGKGKTLRVSPDPGVELSKIYIPDCVISPNPEGYFAVECRNANPYPILLNKQAIGIVSPCTILNTQEAAEAMVEEVYAAENCYLATETVHDLFQATVLKVDSPARKRRQQDVLDKLTINKDLLTTEQYKKVIRLIEDKVEAFATQPSEMGNTDLVEHDIEIVDGTKPIAQRLRRLPFSVKAEITKKIKELLDLAVIKPADSDWASPIVPVRKKDGTICMCIDYRALNKVTRKDNSPLSQLNDLLDRAGMSGNQIFSSFDLMAGYHQVKMSARARRVSTFVSHLGTFEWIRMPFGLCNAPATFSNLMRKVLATIQSNAIFAYLDDVLVASPTVDEHLCHVEEMLDRFISVGLTIQPKKSFLFQNELEFLGFTVSKDGIKATDSKLKAITDFPSARYR